MLDSNIKSVWNCKNNIMWLAFKDNDTYGYYYAESRIYLIRNMKTDVLSIVIASNPEEALTKLLN